MRLSSQDKLRTLLGAQIGPLKVYTQRELAEMLGVSTRTLRRFKNIKGHRLSPRTLEKIKTPLDKENRNFRRYIRDKVVVAETTRSRGKTRTIYKLKKDVALRMPALPVQPIPMVFMAKSGLSRTLKIESAIWSTRQKADYLISAAQSGRFYSWTARIKVPVGVATSGDVESTEVNEEDRPLHYMIGPFSLEPGRGTYKNIEKELAYHEDAGRIVVSVSIIENLPGKP